MSHPAFRASVAIVAALLCTLVAGQANAAEPVPDGGSLMGISCDWGRDSTDLAVTQLDAGTAEANSIGFTDEPFEYFCAYSSNWDRVVASCTSYTVAREPDDARALVRTDLATGESTFVGRFLDGQHDLKMSSVVVDLNGSAWGLARNQLFSVNLSDATYALLTTFDSGWMMGLTLDPADGLLYAHDDTTIYRIDPLTLTIASVGVVPVESAGALGQFVGMAIDSSGAFWFSQPENVDADPGDWTYALWRASASLTDFERVGRMSDESGTIGVFALLALPATACPELPTLPLPDPPTTTPAARLAETGGDVNVTAVAAAATGLIAAGVLLGRRRRRA